MDSFAAYQTTTRTTAIYPGSKTHGDGTSMTALSYLGLGLASEAGEVAGKIKKVIRDDDGVVTPERREAILDEVGDTLWYLARVVDQLGASLGSVAANNLSKLKDRSNRDALNGSGDNR